VVLQLLERDFARERREAVTGRALSWLTQQAYWLAAGDPATAPSEAHQSAMAEHALLLWVARQHGGSGDWQAEFGEIAEVLERTYVATGFQSFLEEGPPEAAIGHLMVRLGLGTARSRRILGDSALTARLTRCNALAVERPPMRQAELLMAMESLGLPHDLPEAAAIYRCSLLARHFGLAELRHSDIYTITHLIFYLTHFGGKSGHPLTAEQERLSAILERLTERLLAERHLDLVAELVICHACLGLAESRTEEAWRLLACAQDQSGAFGAVAMRDEILAADLPAEAYAYDIWLRHYHVCLVTVLAGVLAG